MLGSSLVFEGVHDVNKLWTLSGCKGFGPYRDLRGCLKMPRNNFLCFRA